MLRRVQRKMEELNMVSPQDTILVGVSGGADSVCLLLMLEGLRKDMGFSLEAIHVEHGIRGQESLEDAAFVENLCESMHIVCHKVSVDVPAFCAQNGMGTEEAARMLRYEAFVRVAGEIKGQRGQVKVALAHHMEDNAETMLFQLVRGSSLTGLCGMQPMREDEDGIIYIRPLLFMRREEIENFLMSHKMTWRVDSTNQELEYSRNYLRNMVLPQLTKVNDRAVEHMNKTAHQLQEIHDFLEQETDKAWDKVVSAAGEELFLDVTVLLECHVAVQKQVIHRAIGLVSGSKKDISAVHVEDVLDLCNKQSGREVHLPYGIVARREFQKIYLEHKDFSMEEAKAAAIQKIEVSGADLETMAQSGKMQKIMLSNEGECLLVRCFSYSDKSVKIPKKPYTKWFDYDKIKQGFCIRTRQSGDYFISDAMGHHKKLKSYFVEEKIPAASREKMWILAQESSVLWLIGGRISEHIKVSDNTKLIVEIEYQGGN